MEGSLSVESPSMELLAQEQVMAEHRRTLMTNMIKNKTPKATQRYVIHGTVDEQSAQRASPSAKRNNNLTFKFVDLN